MTLERYLTRRLAGTLGLVMAVFFGMLFLFEAVELVRRLGGQETGIETILWLSLLRVPHTLYQILPLMMILSSMALFLSLARSSELVVIRAAGRPALRMLLAPFVATLLMGALVVATINPMVAGAARMFDRQIAALENPDLVAQISVSDSGIWLRQGDRNGQTVIRAEALEPDGRSFVRLSFLAFQSETGAPVSRIEARRGQLVPGAWELDTAKIWTLDDPNPEQSAQTHARLTLPTDLTPERIQDAFAASGSVSIWALPQLIGALDRAGLATREHRARFHAELALPLLLGGMMLIGAVFCLEHARAGHAGRRILITVLAGFALFFLRNFAQVLGENGQIPIVLAVWAPPVASILLALGILLHLEDG
ncbi:MAG: LPS export ABC transporter permease LptG [Pararhodobacter sp.]